MNPSLRRPLVAGNWKMYKTLAAAKALVDGVRSGMTGATNATVAEVVVAPVAVALSSVKAMLQGSTLGLSAQNMHFEREGAFTGEVSAEMLVDVGCSHVIIGHSERRALFGETDDGVNRKTRAALANGLVPIVCVGESLAQREAGQTEAIVVAQVEAALKDIDAASAGHIVIAYEPIWAIGTGRNAKPEDAEAVHARIRAVVSARYGASLADAMRILYGGSVKPDNAASLMSQPNVDGALVGGASLDATSFLAIVRAAG